MKTIVLSVIFSTMVLGVSAQQARSKKPVKPPVARALPAPSKTTGKSPVISLQSSSSNAAFAETTGTKTIRISDPTIRWYNQIYDYRHPDGNAVIGVPKLSNGIAHGRLIFYPTQSAGSGSYTGSGAVGTGTSLGNIGTNGMVPGVNGKNPYAGPGMYGSRVLSDMRDRDQQSRSLSTGKKDQP